MSELLRGELEWDPETVEDAGFRWADVNGLPIEYRVWSPETSRVVSGPYGPEGYSKFPGRRFRDRRSARIYWHTRATIIEEYRVPGRWIFRVKGNHGAT